MRERLEKQPDWDERFRGWAAKFIAKNMWRCEGHDPKDKFNDLMQDAYIMFRHVLASYPNISDPKHIMALFQIAMKNDFHDRARYKQRKNSVEISLETTIGDDLKLIDTIGENNNEGYLNILLTQLPSNVKLTIEALQDKNKLAILAKTARAAGRLADTPEKRELSNSALCKIIGLPKGTDLLEMIYSALLSEDKMSTEVNTVEQELLAITKFVPEKKYRKRQTYLTALMRAVDALNDEAFDQLSDEAVSWVDKAVQAFKSGQDLPDTVPSNGHAEHEGPHEAEDPELWGAMEVEPPGEGASTEVIHDVETVKPKRTRKPRTAKDPEAAPKVRRPREGSRGANRWGVANGTKAAIVCEMISRPQGATMAEIKEVTGQTQYNAINRLQRKAEGKYLIVKDGLTIRLVENQT